MTTHNPLPVSGYTGQSEVNVALVNQNKRLEEMILRQFDVMSDNPEIDKRWLAVARTHLETAFMAANRAVFKPTRTQV